MAPWGFEHPRPAMDTTPRRTALALSGGNALGAYAAGAYEALHDAGVELGLISGASIGAVTGAIIAGNRPELRMERLHAFWEQAGSGSAPGPAALAGRPRDIYNKMHATQSVLAGRPGLFVPRATGFWSLLPGTPPDVALFDAAPLVPTLHRLIDFDYLNEAHLPLVVSSVDLETGEPVYFDTRRQPLTPQHLLASTAFIPAFPPVEIDGRALGDPGMFCNLPLDPILDSPPPGDLLCIAVDLFEARGPRPRSLDASLERAQDIAFSSQSLRTIDAYRQEHRLRSILARARARLGPAADADPGLADMARESGEGQIDVALLAYRPPLHETGGKTMEFSRASIGERWESGRTDMTAALATLSEGRASTRDPGFAVFDCRRPS